MVDIEFRKPTESDVANLALYLRTCDREELRVSYPGISIEDAVLASVKYSDEEHLFAALTNDHLVCMGGVSFNGSPWLLATDLLTGAVLVAYKAEILERIRLMHAKYPYLYNWIDARQKKQISWLKKLGFTLAETMEAVAGYPLIKFELRASDVSIS